MNPAAQRPPEFDARLLSYLPGMQSLAYKLGYRDEDRDDIVTDTFAYCLEHWQNYREDGGFWNWIYWQMRGMSSNTRARRVPRLVEAGIQYDNAKTMPNQQQYAELCETLRGLTARDGGVLIRLAMGDQLAEIACDMGVSRERARQLGARARARLVASHA